jgi:hypothetical protein
VSIVTLLLLQPQLRPAASHRRVFFLASGADGSGAVIGAVTPPGQPLAIHTVAWFELLAHLGTRLALGGHGLRSLMRQFHSLLLSPCANGGGAPLRDAFGTGVLVADIGARLALCGKHSTKVVRIDPEHTFNFSLWKSLLPRHADDVIEGHSLLLARLA